MSASKTAEAAAKAVAKSNKKEAVQLTPEQVIKNIRRDASQGQFVQTCNWKVLLEEYIKLQELYSAALLRIVELTADAARLSTENDQLLKVYAAENQPQTTVSFFEPPAEGLELKDTQGANPVSE